MLAYLNRNIETYILSQTPKATQSSSSSHGPEGGGGSSVRQAAAGVGRGDTEKVSGAWACALSLYRVWDLGTASGRSRGRATSCSTARPVCCVCCAAFGIAGRFQDTRSKSHQSTVSVQHGACCWLAASSALDCDTTHTVLCCARFPCTQADCCAGAAGGVWQAGSRGEQHEQE